MSDIVETLRDGRYIGQEGMRWQAADEIERLRAALKPFAEVPPHSPPERRCIVMDAFSGPYHFLQSDLDRAKATLTTTEGR